MDIQSTSLALCPAQTWYIEGMSQDLQVVGVLIQLFDCGLIEGLEENDGVGGLDSIPCKSVSVVAGVRTDSRIQTHAT